MSTTAERGVDRKGLVHSEQSDAPQSGDGVSNPNDSGTPGPREPGAQPEPTSEEN